MTGMLTPENGVIKILTSKDKSYYTAEDVMDMLGIGRDKAYRVIRELRREMIDKGKLTSAYPVGKIPKKYFNERCGM